FADGGFGAAPVVPGGAQAAFAELFADPTEQVGQSTAPVRAAGGGVVPDLDAGGGGVGEPDGDRAQDVGDVQAHRFRSAELLGADQFVAGLLEVAGLRRAVRVEC